MKKTNITVDDKIAANILLSIKKENITPLNLKKIISELNKIVSNIKYENNSIKFKGSS